MCSSSAPPLPGAGLPASSSTHGRRCRGERP
jgi:hypothetical protein